MPGSLANLFLIFSHKLLSRILSCTKYQSMPQKQKKVINNMTTYKSLKN